MLSGVQDGRGNELTALKLYSKIPALKKSAQSIIIRNVELPASTSETEGRKNNSVLYPIRSLSDQFRNTKFEAALNYDLTTKITNREKDGGDHFKPTFVDMNPDDMNPDDMNPDDMNPDTLYDTFSRYLFTPKLTEIYIKDSIAKIMLPPVHIPPDFFSQNFKYIFIERLLNNIETFLKLLHIFKNFPNALVAPADGDSGGAQVVADFASNDFDTEDGVDAAFASDAFSAATRATVAAAIAATTITAAGAGGAAGAGDAGAGDAGAGDAGAGDAAGAAAAGDAAGAYTTGDGAAAVAVAAAVGEI